MLRASTSGTGLCPASHPTPRPRAHTSLTSTGDHGRHGTGATAAAGGGGGTEGFDKVDAGDGSEKAIFAEALGNDPAYAAKTSPSRYLTSSSEVPDTVGVYRPSPARQRIERGYLAKVAATGARTTTIDARSLSHAEVNRRIGAPGDTVMTPPLVAFLTTCFA